MKHIFLLFAVIFLFHSNFVSYAQTAISNTAKAPQLNPNIKFEISIFNTSLDNTINEGDGIRLRIVFKNVTSTNQEFLLDDHSATAGTLDYPDFLFARISDASGKLTTQNKDFDDGWFTSTCDGGRAEVFKPEPGDIITLKPGEQVTRIIPLWELLADCNTTSRIEPLRTGKNTIQLRLLDIYSNKLEIEILPKEK